jgi:molybdopterin-binding protein
VNGQKLVAVVTMDALSELGLAEGKDAVALIKADHVILGVD